MSVDTLLRDAATELAGATTSPTVDLDLVRSGADRLRRRRFALAAGIALAVVATALLVSRPEPTASAPAPPPFVPGPEPLAGLVDQPVWADALGLHIGPRRYDPGGSAVTQIALLWTGVVYVDSQGGVWLQPPTGTPERVGQHALRATLAASDDGVTAAWVERVPGIGNPELKLVTIDATAPLQPRAVTVAFEPDHLSRGRGDHVAAATAVEYVTADSVLLRVKPEGALYRFSRSTGAAEPVSVPADFVVLDRTSGLFATASTFRAGDQRISFRNETGRVVAHTGPLEASGVFNQAGAWFLAVDQTARGHAVRVVDPRTGETKHLTGDSVRYPVVSWGYGRTAMVSQVDLTDDGVPATLHACDARTSVCQQLPVRPGRNGLVLPAP